MIANHACCSFGAAKVKKPENCVISEKLVTSLEILISAPERKCFISEFCLNF